MRRGSEDPTDVDAKTLKFSSSVGVWLLTGGGFRAVEERATGAFVGTMGAFFRETAPDQVELGWTVVRAFWGRGIASEAATAAARYAFETQRAPSLHAYIDPKSVASVRVAEACTTKGRPTSTARPPASTNSCDRSSRGELPNEAEAMLLVAAEAVRARGHVS